MRLQKCGVNTIKQLFNLVADSSVKGWAFDIAYDDL